MSRRELLRLGSAGAAGAALLGFSGCTATSSSSGSRELKIGINAGWIESVAISNLTKVLLEDELGYESVELQSIELGPLFQGVSEGDLDAFQDLWMPQTHRQYWEEVGDEVVRLEPWYEGEANLGLAVPDYVKEVQSIADLGEHREMFDGEIVGIEPGAGEMGLVRDEVIPGYELDYELLSSSTPAMLSTLEDAVENERPVVITAWKPHFMFTAYPIRYLQDPKNAMGGAESISSVTREGLEEESPVAFALMESIRLSEDQLGELELSIQDSETAPEGSRAWVESNRDAAEPWVSDAEQARQG